jgi:hypothetical protein
MLVELLIVAFTAQILMEQEKKPLPTDAVA